MAAPLPVIHALSPIRVARFLRQPAELVVVWEGRVIRVTARKGSLQNEPNMAATRLPHRYKVEGLHGNILTALYAEEQGRAEELVVCCWDV